MKKVSYDTFFRALANKTRLGIIESLRESPKNVTGLAKSTGREQSLISHNLMALKAWGLVSAERDGREVVYSIDGRNLDPVLDAVERYLSRHQDTLCGCGILKGGRTCKRLRGG